LKKSLKQSDHLSGKPGNGSWKAVSKLMYSQGITGQYMGNFFERFALKFVAQVMAVIANT